MTDPSKPAFGHGDHTHGGAPGMTYREWLIGMALQGILANPDTNARGIKGSALEILETVSEGAAAVAIAAADAVIKQLQEEG